MQKLLQNYLRFLAKILLFFKKPYIIGVTGTAGKTTISRFLVQFLESSLGEGRIGYSQYNYNGEFGLPLAIIGAKSGGKNPFLWGWVALVTIGRLFQKYPEYLVLEYGIDHPGEMDFLLSIAVPDVAIISPIVPNHMEQFKTEKAYFGEKIKILAAKKSIIHESVAKKIPSLPKNTSVYGFESFPGIILKNTPKGISGNINYKGENINFFLPFLGKYQWENILPVVITADILHIPKNTYGSILNTLQLEAGRSRILQGIEGSIVVDGSYNGGFLSITEGITSLRDFTSSHNIVVFLGDMRELGDFEKSKHEELAAILEKTFDNEEATIILVGKCMEKYVYPLLRGKRKVRHFLSSREAGECIKQEILSSKIPSLVYAKGSQNTIFLEEWLKKILEKKDHHLLSRQSRDWLIKKEKFFQSLEQK